MPETIYWCLIFSSLSFTVNEMSEAEIKERPILKMKTETNPSMVFSRDNYFFVRGMGAIVTWILLAEFLVAYYKIAWFI